MIRNRVFWRSPTKRSRRDRPSEEGRRRLGEGRGRRARVPCRSPWSGWPIWLAKTNDRSYTSMERLTQAIERQAAMYALARRLEALSTCAPRTHHKMKV